MIEGGRPDERQLKEVRVLVTGRVQGVGFRMTVQHLAVKRGLSGTVRNLSDGRVEVVAAGPGQALESFLEELRNSPGASRVDSLDKEDRFPATHYTSFTIL